MILLVELILQAFPEAFPRQRAICGRFYRSSHHFQTPGLDVQKYFHINAHSAPTFHQALKIQNCILVDFDQTLSLLKRERCGNSKPLQILSCSLTSPPSKKPIHFVQYCCKKPFSLFHTTMSGASLRACMPQGRNSSWQPSLESQP